MAEYEYSLEFPPAALNDLIEIVSMFIMLGKKTVLFVSSKNKQNTPTQY